MDIHISKPVEPGRLLAAVATQIEGGDTFARRPARPTAPEALDRALARLQSDKGLFRKIVRQFLEGVPPARTRLASAVEQRDARAVAFEAHRLRGQAASFDAFALVSAIDAMAAAAARSAWPDADQALRRIEVEVDRLTADLTSHAA